VYQVGINKGIILRCTAYQISKLIMLEGFFYICTVHSRYEDFFIKILLMHSL